MLCDRLKEVGGGAIKHIDLWNHNVEFIEQEENWERPAVFIEFRPIKWNAIVNGLEYRAEPEVALHVVTDWKGGTSDGSQFQEEGLEVFDLVESDTNHNHEDIVENIEIYRCVAIKSMR